MPIKEINVSVENQVIKLSNLNKILFPKTAIIKAELIQYYQKIAPIMLPHIMERPLTLIRFPDGIDKIKFYSKNKADYTPDWIKYTKVPVPLEDTTKPENEEIEYIMANNTAALVYLANLAAIEIHSMTIRADNFKPDIFIFDLDPPDGIDFQEIKNIAYNLKLFLENKAYTPFLKTSGSKGLHIYVPIVANYTTQQVVETVKSLAKEFISNNPNTTLLLNKERRTNKILIDIYRNHRSQTCAAPYSVRGKEGAPISTPISWDNFESLDSSKQYNIHNIFDYLSKNGDPWANINDYITELRPVSNTKSEILKIENSTKTEDLTQKESVDFDTENSLKKYAQKRDFNSTNEPIPEIKENKTGILRYVIHKHNATNLHYDLRLEFEGVLLSWAIPKALPIMPSEKRMAIQTEPHPIKYIDFEGIIPKEEYGGGEMWVFDTGNLTYLKKEDNKIKFCLKNGKISGEFSIYKTEANKWLIEKKEEGLKIDTISVNPMLCELALKIPDNQKYFYEIKWDGIRVTIRKSGDLITIFSKNGNELTEKFPKIVEAVIEMNVQSAVFDGEIVCLDAAGIPNFAKVISRMHQTGKEAIQKASIYNKATCYLFDLLYIDGLDCRNIPIEKRRKWLNISFSDTEYLRFSQSFPDGTALLEAIKSKKMEGIICKRIGSIYQNNIRAADWQKIKIRNTEDALIIGYTRGQGDRALLFGALILAQYDDETLVYKGKVGSGFNIQKLKEILSVLSKIPKSKKIIKETIDEEANAIWIEPKLWCEVQIASLTVNNTFREPVFVKMREDLTLNETSENN
jgi:bifunctional non-homologous end joining protein LigD